MVADELLAGLNRLRQVMRRASGDDPGRSLRLTQEPGGDRLWYDDGDLAAEVVGDLGLGIEASDVATVVVALVNAWPAADKALREAWDDHDRTHCGGAPVCDVCEAYVELTRTLQQDTDGQARREEW